MSKEKLDKYHYHEAVDRAFMVLEIFNDHVAEHPVVEKHKLLKKLAKQISNDLYQLCNTASNISCEKHKDGKK